MEGFPGQMQGLPDALHLQLTDSAVSTINAVVNRPTRGEIILRRTNDQQLVVHRFTLMADADTYGMVSKLLRHATVRILNYEETPQLAKLELEIPFTSLLSHSSMTGGFLIDDGSAHVPHHMIFHGQLNLSLIRHERPERNWRVQAMNFLAECPHDYPDTQPLVQKIQADWLGQVEVTELDLSYLGLSDSAETFDAQAGPTTQSGLWHEIKLRPLWFSSNNADISLMPEILNFIQVQVQEAQELWGRGLVNITVDWKDAGNKVPYQVLNNSFLAEGMVVYTVDSTESLSDIASHHGVQPAEIVPYNFNIKSDSTFALTPSTQIFLNIPTHTPYAPSGPKSKISSMDEWSKAIYCWLSNSPDPVLQPKLGVIDIYFTSFIDSQVLDDGELVKFDGGGITHSSNTAYAHCLLTDRRLPSKANPTKMRWMDYLLAHEFGHVLGLRHPTNTTFRSDGQIPLPKMTVKAFRWDPTGGTAYDCNCGGTNSSDGSVIDPGRMCSIICNFDEIWETRDFASPNQNKYSRAQSNNILNDIIRKDPLAGVTFPADKQLPDYPSLLQDCLDQFIDQLTEAEIGPASENPVLVLFIRGNESASVGDNDYHMGMSSGSATNPNPKRFAVPIFVFNKAADKWNTEFNDITFVGNLYYFLRRPNMHRSNFGTLMDPETPDPAVLDLEICNAVINGISTTSRLVEVGATSINPALQLKLTNGLPTSADFKDTKTFEMYIPTAKGDVGRIARNDWWPEALYHSPYMWNSYTDLTQASETDIPTGGGTPIQVLEKIRLEFFEPASTINALNPIPPDPNKTNYLYIHVRLRSNNKPAGINTASDLRNYFENHTRVYVGMRFPGMGGTADSILPLKPTAPMQPVDPKMWYCEKIAQPIMQTNQFITAPTDDDIAAAHPYVAGFTAVCEWTPPQELPLHFCICAFVITSDTDLIGYNGTVLATWQQVNGQSPKDNSKPWGISDLTLSDDDWVNLSNTNLQWMWHNMDRAVVSPNFGNNRRYLSPLAIHVNNFQDSGQGEPVYYIRRHHDSPPLDVYINRFDKSREDFQQDILAFNDGLATVSAGNTSLRTGIYGISLGVDWKGDFLPFALDIQSAIGNKVLDSYRFYLQASHDLPASEALYAQETFGTLNSALLSTYQQFQLDVAKELLDSLDTLSSVTLANIIAWPRGNGVPEKLRNLRQALATQVGEDMVVLRCFDQFMASLNASDDYKMLSLLNCFFDHLHFLVLLYSQHLAAPPPNGNHAPPPAK